MTVWLEVHVDDVLLSRAPDRWPDAAALLDRLARVAESEGGRLSFRVRRRFASLDRDGFLQGLVARGHEVGAHAHGKDLAAGVFALRRAGIQPTVFAPGFVQVGRSGWKALAYAARALGCTRLTDRMEHIDWAWQGWLPWERIPGVTSTDVSVSPLAWGVLRRAGNGVVRGIPDFTALAGCTEAQARRVVPEGCTAFFGATFHEHDIADGQLVPHDLDGLRRYCGTYRPVPSASGPSAVEWPEPSRRSPFRPLRRARLDAARGAWPSRPLRVGDREIQVRRVGPSAPLAALVVVHAGRSGLEQGLGVLGLPEDALPELAVWTYARSEGARTPGNPDHIAEAKAVVAAARAEGHPVVLLSWSGGIVPALHAADGVALFIDVEGPADRLSLVPPGGNELSARDPFDDAAWTGIEAVALARGLAAPYLRIQGSDDHQHGPALVHARQMVTVTGGELVVLPGRIADHGAAVGAAILRRITAAVRA